MSDTSSDESRGPSPVPSIGSRNQQIQPPASPAKQQLRSDSPVESQPQLQPQPQRGTSQSRNRGRSRTRRNSSVASTISDAGPEEVLPNGNKRRKRKNKKRQQQNALPVVDEVEATGREVVETAGGAVQAVGDTAGAVTQAANPSGGGSDKPLKLRLDLNLDADIRLTAKVHGDITLSLL
ncbi:hypothetical protein Agabi119p4_2249 [Agaricus bisporus var. burnettii]|uniref:Uncharacterized protein n=1 Tax=Agaricus bisporus var. burnettii TaxID=192524 RepID=A0A8H7F8W2_AGABI|nr:hypothetical protein Agabi119p4_2249 [Agaricus bisporus var. burnettii]